MKGRTANMKESTLKSNPPAFLLISIILIVIAALTSFSNAAQSKGLPVPNNQNLKQAYMYCTEHSSYDTDYEVLILVQADESVNQNFQQERYTLIAPYEIILTEPELVQVSALDIIGLGICGFLAEEKLTKYLLRKKGKLCKLLFPENSRRG
ncbi:MAG: hypothetical protein JW804_09235 [Sedimentisphaerales bacterium]|nr:hypothetical protein [Sedimentisphaerales bacterium]